MVSCTVAENDGSGGTTQICEEGSANTRQSLQQSCNQAAANALPDAGGLNISAKLVDGPCSRVGALGGCQISEGSATLAVWYYEDPDGVLTVDEVKKMCAALHETYLAP